MSDTGDDLAKYLISAGAAIPTLGKRVPYETRANRKRNERFVMVPWVWSERLMGARNASTLKLALHVLLKNFESHGRPFKLANGVLRMKDVSRWQKCRGVGELEQLGLITVERRLKKAPVITVHLIPLAR